MKVAEALMERADLQKRFAQLQQRINEHSIFQQDTQPDVDVVALFHEAQNMSGRISGLVISINNANHKLVNAFEGHLTRNPYPANLMTLLTARDELHRSIGLVRTTREHARPRQRYSRDELPEVSAFDTRELLQQQDRLSQQLRELDAEIQRLNWLVDI